MPRMTPLILTLASCSGLAAAPVVHAAIVRHASGPLEELRSRAEREISTPDARTRGLPPPPGIDAAAVRELAPEDRSERSLAGMPLAKVLAAIAEKGPPPALSPISPVPPEDDEAAAEAQKLYAAGRQAASDGQPADALTSLQEAAKLDPSGAAVWREIAECQNALGRRAAAVAAMQQAVRRGLKDVAGRAFLGREALRGLRMDEAAWLLGGLTGNGAGGSGGAGSESPAGVINDLQLAEALDRLGYAGASAEIFARALASPHLSAANARVFPEMAETLRRRGELWQRLGDLAMRLGRLDSAMVAYEAAAKEPTLDAGALAVRRVYAAVRAGRPAQAALALVEKFQRTGGFIEERELAVVRYLADRTDVGPALAGAMDATLAPNAATPSARSRLARAKAAALPLDARRDALVDHLAKDPTDRRAAADLIGGFGQGGLEERDAAMVAVVRKRPHAVDTVAALLLADGRGVFAAAERLGKSSDPASTLLAAYLRSALGSGAEAVALLRPEAAPAEMQAEMLGAKADLAGLCGDYATAEAALRSLEALPAQATVHARMRALTAIQRFTDAKAAGAELEHSPSTEDRMFLAGVALQAGDLDLAERLLTALAEEDPQDERPAEVLLRLYSRGVKADQRLLSSVVQRLRDKVSSSRVLRWATSTELMQRGQWAAAEQSLLSLAEEDPTSIGLLDSLVTVWIRGGAAAMERGETWLRARATAAPESIDAVAALAQIVAARGSADEALAILHDATARRPIERLLRLRELIVSESKDDPAEAGRLAAERLSKLPRTIDNSITLGEVLIGLGRETEVDSVVRSLPATVPFTAEQKQRLTRLMAIVLRADEQAVAAGKPATSTPVIETLERLGVEADAQVWESMLVLACLAESPDKPRIASIFDKLAAASREEQALFKIRERILATKRPAAMLPFAEAIATARPEPGPFTLFNLCLALGAYGDGPDLTRLMPDLTKGDRAEKILDIFAQIDGMPMPPPGKRPGLIAFRIAGAADKRFEQAARFYEISITLDPSHAIAYNNYGYLLLEHLPQDRAKIESLLEKAYQTEPESHNIADSLGWLRYKQGRFEDDPAKGAIGGAGALSLLKRALELQEQEEDDLGGPTVMDHYGDALWLAGRREEAKVQWKNAAARADRVARENADNQDDSDYAAVKASATAKLQAADAGKEPPVAPRWDAR